MTETTKTIQIYKPEEKLPAVGCNYIAITKGYEFDDKEFHTYIPDMMYFGTISDSNSGAYMLIDALGCTTRLNADEFKKKVLEWYYLPC